MRRGNYSNVAHDIKHGVRCSIGDYTKVGKGVVLGDDVKIGDYCVIGDKCIVGNRVTIQGQVRLGKYCWIGFDSVIKWGAVLTSHVKVGSNVFFGTGAVTLGSDKDRKENHGTVIGDDVYIGGRAIVAPNIKIKGNDVGPVIIGALAFVRENISAGGTYVGIPAKRKR